MWIGNSMNVKVIQPAIPKYRVPFFLKLIKIYRQNISFFSAEIDFLGVRSDVVELNDNVILSKGFWGYGILSFGIRVCLFLTIIKMM